MINFHNTDNIEFMKSKPDNYYRLAIVDPQTGQDEGKKHASRPAFVKQKNGTFLNIEKRHKEKDWDSKAPDQLYYDELFRVSQDQIIMCENQLYFNQKDSSAGRIVWNLLRENDFSSCNIMWTSLTNKIDYFEYMWNGMMQGEKINSRIQIGNKSKNQKRIHPSEKPIKVYCYLLQNYAQIGWNILDTHGGSAAIAIACDILGFDLDICELDNDYYEESKQRFEWHKRQLQLF